MSSNTLPDLSPEHAYARRIAARELARYCQEFDRWRTRKRDSAGSVHSPRLGRILVPRLNEKPGPLEPHSAA
jgi:hypothetical protein